MYSRSGLGDTALQLEQVAGGVASGVVPAVVAGGAAASAAAGGSGLILGMAPTLAVPVIGAAIVAVTAVISIWLAKNAQYHAQETATTTIVDQAEKFMKQNLAAWNASSKTESEQAQAIANYNAIWAQVEKACDVPAYGDPGKRCISDREEGGITPWPDYYLKPIQNDPNVVSDLSSATALVSSVTGGNPSLLPWLIGGLVLFAVAEL